MTLVMLDRYKRETSGGAELCFVLPGDDWKGGLLAVIAVKMLGAHVPYQSESGLEWVAVGHRGVESWEHGIGQGVGTL